MLSNTHFSMAIHVLTALAYNEGETVGSEQLATTVGTNSSFLRGLIGQLRDAGLVETHLGKGGGTVLARNPSKINLLDVYRATESGPAVKTHRCDGRSKCIVARGMNPLLKSVNDRVEAVVESELRKTTISALLKEYVR